MANHPKLSLISDSASRDIDKSMPLEIRLLRIAAMPVTLLVNMAKGCWFLLCGIADALWEDAFR